MLEKLRYANIGNQGDEKQNKRSSLQKVNDEIISKEEFAFIIKIHLLCISKCF